MADSAHMDYVHPPSRIFDIVSKLDFFGTPVLQYTCDFRWEQSPAPMEHVGKLELLQSRSIFGKRLKNSYMQLVRKGFY